MSVVWRLQKKGEKYSANAFRTPMCLVRAFQHTHTLIHIRNACANAQWSSEFYRQLGSAWTHSLDLKIYFYCARTRFFSRFSQALCRLRLQGANQVCLGLEAWILPGVLSCLAVTLHSTTASYLLDGLTRIALIRWWRISQLTWPQLQQRMRACKTQCLTYWCAWYHINMWSTSLRAEWSWISPENHRSSKMFMLMNDVSFILCAARRQITCETERVSGLREKY